MHRNGRLGVLGEGHESRSEIDSLSSIWLLPPACQDDDTSVMSWVDVHHVESVGQSRPRMSASSLWSAVKHRNIFRRSGLRLLKWDAWKLTDQRNGY